ncbi:MAG TPA: rhodanese-like domain-containing protein [Candidatus Sulfotelmatobacter sp.]|nr:rhodanese-like domain-containing protein [Candidatus Sulfotelmatobacter sp.]
MSDAVPLQVGVDELDRWRRGVQPVAILDVREPWEREICALPDSIDIPMAELPERVGELPTDRTLVVVCHHGMRSLQVTRWLRAHGHALACNLQGGIDAWASQIDDAMKRY